MTLPVVIEIRRHGAARLPVVPLQDGQHLGPDRLGGGAHRGLALAGQDGNPAVGQRVLHRLGGGAERLAAVAAR